MRRQRPPRAARDGHDVLVIIGVGCVALAAVFLAVVGLATVAGYVPQ